MKKKIIALFCVLVSFSAHAKINHIFVDINLLLETCTKAATKEVGLWNATKYCTYMGKSPNKAMLFKALKDCPAQSNLITYNEDLAMPLILSDWLLGLQKNSIIKQNIFKYLDRSSMSDIEKTVYKNISNMMLTPSIFIDTQLIKKDIGKIMQKLHKHANYNFYIIGNWDKESEPLLIKLLQNHHIIDPKHCIFSNKLHQLKPHDEYFSTLIDYCNVNPQECLMIDVEKKHIQGAHNIGMSTILIQHQNASQLKQELSKYNIYV